MNQDRENFLPFCGYHQNWKGDHDHELAETGPGSVCGDYLRRYWHPVAMTQDLENRPRLIRILGEELVLFRDTSNRIGLVHKNCPHRRASLEFGKCEDRGIRCCYHGWLFDVDGTILEIPGTSGDSASTRRVMESTRLGAYPVKEFRGLVFAYMGPIDEQPPFPHYDAYDLPDMVMSPYAAPFQCNWIQVLDAIVDPVHTAYLHHNQFTEGFGKCGEIQFYERHKIRFLGTATRRVGENIWVRVNELILPNFTQSGAAFSTDGTKTRYFGRSAFTRWVVPVDDENCIAFAWGNFGERGDPEDFNTREGMERMEQGEIIDRTYEERQASPGDVEAVEGMGSISEHGKEHLVAGDRGVALYRRRIRRLARDLAKGILPPQPADLAKAAIPTYGSDSVIHCPGSENHKDTEQLRQTNDLVMDIIFSGDNMSGGERDHHIITALQKI
jgi:nitrite reductase/ring-hydroxylating ferredoxin subunit